MKMYRNYDGNKSTFGDTSVSATGPNPDRLAVFAAKRSADGALTIMAINKITNATPVLISLANFLPAGSAQVWQLTSANTINHLSDLAFTGNTLSNSPPAQSITLFVLPPGAPPRLRDRALTSAGTFSFWLEGRAGERYALLGSSNFVNWTVVQTNALATSSLAITPSLSNAWQFYRAQWLP